MIRVEIERKKKVLHELKKRVQEQGIIPSEYYRETDEGMKCFCTVGHIMDICGVNVKEIPENQIGDNVIGLNLEFVEPMLNWGFSVQELQNLQDVNDDTEDKEQVVSYIDNMLEELNK